MRFFRKYTYILYFPAFYIGLIAFDFFNHHEFKWLENLIQSSFYVLFLMFFNWAFNDKNKKNEKKT